MLYEATSELPIAFALTNAAEHESPRLPDRIDYVAERHPTLLERAETLGRRHGRSRDMIRASGVGSSRPSA